MAGRAKQISTQYEGEKAKFTESHVRWPTRRIRRQGLAGLRHHRPLAKGAVDRHEETANQL
jgi:hypothetical protein